MLVHRVQAAAAEQSEDAVEHALVVVVLASAPGVQRVCDHGQDDLHALRLRQVQVEALAQVVDGARARLEARAPAVCHHLHQQDDAVGMLAAGQETLDAQHLHPHAVSTSTHARYVTWHSLGKLPVKSDIVHTGWMMSKLLLLPTLSAFVRDNVHSNYTNL